LIELLGYAEDVDFSGIGFYEKKNFLHLDVRPTKRTRWRESCPKVPGTFGQLFEKGVN